MSRLSRLSRSWLIRMLLLGLSVLLAVLIAQSDLRITLIIVLILVVPGVVASLFLDWGGDNPNSGGG